MSSCIPLFACMPQTGVYLIGRAFGWNKGTLAAESNTGFICTGPWALKDATGEGKAQLTCDNGLTGTITFFYKDNAQGRASGFGVMSNGLRIRGWTGHDMRQLLISDSGEFRTDILCSDRQRSGD